MFVYTRTGYGLSDDDIERMRRRIRLERQAQGDVDSQQNDRIHWLEQEAVRTKLYLLSVTKALVEKGVLSEAEVSKIAASVEPPPPPPAAPDPTTDGMTPELCDEPPASD